MIDNKLLLVKTHLVKNHHTDTEVFFINQSIILLYYICTALQGKLVCLTLSN